MDSLATPHAVVTTVLRRSALSADAFGARVEPRPSGWLLRCSFAAVFVATLCWFGLVDVYRRHFFTAGPLYLGYTIARVVFIVYLGWCQYYLGRLVLQFCERLGSSPKLRSLDEFLLCFFGGGACLAAITFCAGVLNLYYYWVFVIGSVALVTLSSAALTPTVERWWADLAAAVSDRRRTRRYAFWLAAGCVIVLATMLLVLRGLYPGGMGDYYTHYLPYYRHVLNSHGLWPNDVWYHFYVSKGATVIISSMILTDVQAPETVTFLYFMVATLCVYSMLRHIANNRIVPCLGMAACLGAFIWPDAMPGNVAEWGIFQKHHELTGSLLLSVAWIAASCVRESRAAFRAWSVFVALLAGHGVLFAPTIFPLVLAALASVLLPACVRRAWSLAATALAGIVAAAVVVMGLLIFNYLCTGLAEVTPLRSFWKHADQERFSHWVSPYLMTLLLEGSSPDMCKVQLVDHEGRSRAAYLRALARAHYVRFFFPDATRPVPPFLLCVLLVALVRLWRRWSLSSDVWRMAAPVIAVFVSALVLSQLVTQPVSVYRYYSFMVFFVVLIALALWVALFRLIPSRKLVLTTGYLLPALLTCIVTYCSLGELPAAEFKQALQFACGGYSLADGYRTRLVTNEIPVEVFNVIGPGTRVYSLTLATDFYSTAPDCEIEAFVSFSLRDDWHNILFENPERARAALQKQDLNHFLINVDQTPFDIVPYAPLLRGENIDKYLAVRWRRGDTYLLTWPGPDTTPIPEEFLEKYRRPWKPNTAPGYDPRLLYEHIRTIYEANRGRSYPIQRDPSLPRAKGWQ